MIAVSIGYMLSQYPTSPPVAINVATVLTIVIKLGRLNAAISLSHGVIDTPIANRSGYVTAVDKNLYTTNPPCCRCGETALVSFASTARNSIATGAGRPNS